MIERNDCFYRLYAEGNIKGNIKSNLIRYFTQKKGCNTTTFLIIFIHQAISVLVLSKLTQCYLSILP